MWSRIKCQRSRRCSCSWCCTSLQRLSAIDCGRDWHATFIMGTNRMRVCKWLIGRDGAQFVSKFEGLLSDIKHWIVFLLLGSQVCRGIYAALSAKNVEGCQIVNIWVYIHTFIPMYMCVRELNLKSHDWLARRICLSVFCLLSSYYYLLFLHLFFSTFSPHAFALPFCFCYFASISGCVGNTNRKANIFCHHLNKANQLLILCWSVFCTWFTRLLVEKVIAVMEML